MSNGTTRNKSYQKKTRGTGRPRAEINWEVVDDLLAAGCNGVEIASYLGIYPDTLYNACEREHNSAFSAYAQIKRARGDVMLKKVQFDQALNGDKTMLVWLGKQRLEQRDIPTPKSAIADDVQEDLLKGVTKEQLLDMLADDAAE